MWRCLVPVCLLLLAQAASAGEFVHPKWKYRAGIPAGWSQKLSSGNLLLAGPAGFRGQVETYFRPDDLQASDAEGLMRSDGGKLKKAYGAVKIVQSARLSQEPKVGARTTYSYALRYQPKRGGRLYEARGYAASGPTEGGSTRIWIRVLAYGSAVAWKQNYSAFEKLLASIEWPGGAPPTAPPPVATQAPAPVYVAADTSTDPVETTESYDSGDGGEYQSKNAAFDRGSKKGGMGFMKYLKRSTNTARDKRLLKAWTPDGSDARTEEQQDQAAQRLGFNERY